VFDPACKWNPLFSQIVELAVKHSTDGTFGSRAFLFAILDMCLKRGELVNERPYTANMLLNAHREYGRLSQAPAVKRLIERLRSEVTSTMYPEDFEYILTIGEDGLYKFRVMSVLGDYVQTGNQGVLIPHRALLTHFGQEFGFYTKEQIEELEELINNPNVKERELQKFFEHYPHFFRKWDYREVFAQVHLCRPEGNLVPDFILTNRELQYATIVELKLPRARLIRHQDNRVRFGDAVMEARAQLLTYKEWFRQKKNREMLKQKVGMEIYEPRLSIVIGRASEFQCEYNRQLLGGRNPDVEVVTYDDILMHARRRRMIIEGTKDISEFSPLGGKLLTAT
ncbi:Shedu anti-phage system protein SduA domain-containing protein, partial [Planctomycetota bacterium]